MSRAVVLLSGGLDSTVTLAHALSRGEEVIPLTFLYGQRHRRELLAAKEVADHYDLDDHVIMEMDLGCFSSSALTGDLEVPEGRPVGSVRDIPVTYVPARNIIFLSIASGLCESESADRVYIGANAVDYSGYPDCRPQFFREFERVLEVGTKAGVEGHPVRVVTPIIDMTKGEIVRTGRELDAPLHLTWSCYKGGERACGRCDSCLLRLRGFREAGLRDPVRYEE
ncbi:MAG: 7-cyano-7-deazaguanine synthase QueC [Methanomassiliicoccales archaeon]